MTVRPLGRRSALAAGVVALLALGSAAPAGAQVPLPLPGVGGVLGAGTDIVTGGLSGAAVDGFGAILRALFGSSERLISRDLLAWLVAVPDYAIAPQTSGPARGSGSSLAELGKTTSIMAFAMLGAVGTVSVARFWAAGLSGSGGFEALQGIGRTVAAALFVVAWPWLFRHSADLSNQAARALLGSGSVLEDVRRLLQAAFGLAVSLNFFTIVIACAAGLLFVALLVSKVVVSATTAVIFVAMPLPVVLWVIPELAWPARAGVRAFGTVMAIPFAWAVCFATFAAVGTDALALRGAGSAVESLIMPLIAVALLWLTVKLPRTLGRMAMLGATNGSGFVAHTASFVAARRIDHAVAGVAPVLAATAVGGPPPAAGAGAHLRAHSSMGPATAAAQVDRAASAAGVSSAVSPPSPSRPRPVGESAPSAPAPPENLGAAGSPVDREWRHPAWGEIRAQVPTEQATAARRAPATRPEDVARALQSLQPDTQQRIADLMRAHDGRIRGQMTHQAARHDLSPDQREAYRTLAAATPEALTGGFDMHLNNTSAAPGDVSTPNASSPAGPAPAPGAAGPAAPAPHQVARPSDPPAADHRAGPAPRSPEDRR